MLQELIINQTHNINLLFQVKWAFNQLYNVYFPPHACSYFPGVFGSD